MQYQVNIKFSYEPDINSAGIQYFECKKKWGSFATFLRTVLTNSSPFCYCIVVLQPV